MSETDQNIKYFWQMPIAEIIARLEEYVSDAPDAATMPIAVSRILAELARVKAELDLVKTGRVRWIVTYGERWYGRQENGEWESFDTFDEAVAFAMSGD